MSVLTREGGARRVRVLLAEAAASARAQPVASALTLLIVAGMVVAVLLTTGRTVAAEQNVLSSIDSAGTRSITVRAEDGAGVTSGVLGRIAGIEGIEWAAAFSSAVDATNTLIPDGTRVPVRYAYRAHLERLGVPTASAVPGGLAYASDRALAQLGMPDASGGIHLTDGSDYALAGRLDVPDFLEQLEPVVIVPVPGDAPDATVNLLIVIADRPDLVTPVSDAVLSVLAADDPSKVTVQTSEQLARLRALVQGQLGSFSRGLVIVMLALTGSLVAVIQFGLVMMRRKDFGRRRALGATRSLIVGLLLCQTALLAAAGAALGVAVGYGFLVASGDPLPGTAFTLAIAVLGVVTAVVAAVVPAIVASRREPIRELRVA